MSSVYAIIDKARKTMLKYGLVIPGDRVVVGVSGGPDSVCLLDILYLLRQELDIELVVAHIDHGLRPAEDLEETRFVASLAEARNLPFETEGVHLDPAGGSLENRARRARYRFFEEVRVRFSAQKIALGHQRNDQAETVLMRLLRGSGMGGLSGIAPVRDGKIIRPILELGRPEIKIYLRERGLHFKTDPTNREEKFLRNRIRSVLIPALEEYQPRVIDILAQTADILREDNHYLEVVSGEWLAKRAKVRRNDLVEISVKELLELPLALRKRIIRHCVNIIAEGLSGVSLRHIAAVHQLAAGRKSQGTVRLPKGLVVARIYDRLSFKKATTEKASDYLYILKKSGRFVLEEVSCTLSMEEMPRGKVSIREDNPWTACLDAQKIRYPLALRNFRPGDRFVPLGMRGRKKVKDFFIDRKVPNSVRSRLPILLSGGEILWICGMMIDERVKVSTATEKVLKITFLGVPDFQGGEKGKKGETFPSGREHGLSGVEMAAGKRRSRKKRGL